MEDHQIAVATIAAQVRSFHERKVPFRIYHGSTNSTRIIALDPDKIIDTSALSNVISIDKTSKTVVVQPNVPMDALVRQTLPHGLVPAVVPEFPGITVGGSYSGTAAESSSFRYGYFDRTVNWVEIVLPNGNIVKASPKKHADLFYGAAGAMGTLGVTTLFEVQLIPSEMYVETTYVPVQSVSEALSTLERLEKDESISYLDAILYSTYSGVIIVGRFTSSTTDKDGALLPIAQFSRAKDPWFFLHVHTKFSHLHNTHCLACLWQKQINNGLLDEPPMTELIPTYDYFFRYDRGSFWMGGYGWNGVPFNRYTRFLLDRMFRTRNMYKAMHHSNQSQRFVVQDLAIPEENAQQFLAYVETDIQIYPLWLCPIRGDSKAALHTAKNYALQHEGAAASELPSATPRMLINIGVWGVPQLSQKVYNAANFHEFVDLNRDIERKVRELGGLKWLYAHNYYTEDEFWEGYDRERYEGLREKWGASGMLSIWDKVKRDKEDWVWKPVNFPRALLLTALGRDHLLDKKKKKSL